MENTESEWVRPGFQGWAVVIHWICVTAENSVYALFYCCVDAFRILCDWHECSQGQRSTQPRWNVDSDDRNESDLPLSASMSTRKLLETWGTFWYHITLLVRLQVWWVLSSSICCKLTFFSLWKIFTAKDGGRWKIASPRIQSRTICAHSPAESSLPVLFTDNRKK